MADASGAVGAVDGASILAGTDAAPDHEPAAPGVATAAAAGLELAPPAGSIADRHAYPALLFEPDGAPPPEDGHDFQYDRHMRYRARHGKEVDDPDPTKETLDGCLQRMGYSARDLEGHCNRHQQAFFWELLDDHPWVERVMEIGFNAGHSSHCLLSHARGIQLTSFDIMLHGYARHAKVYIDKAFPGRHTLVAGDSVHAVPSFTRAFPGVRADLIFVDGDHRYMPALVDMLSMRAFAHADTILVVDNVAPHRGMGRQVYFAWRELLRRGVLQHVAYVETDDFRDAWAVARYAAPGWEAPSRPVALRGAPRGQDAPTLESGQPNFDWIERRVAVHALARQMERAGSLPELEDLQRQMAALDAEGRDRVDAWGRELFGRLRGKLERSAGGGAARDWAHRDGQGPRGGGGGAPRGDGDPKRARYEPPYQRGRDSFGGRGGSGRRDQWHGGRSGGGGGGGGGSGGGAE